MSTRTTRRVKTAKICNQSVGFRLWWVNGRLKFSQPASGRLDKNVDFYPQKLTQPARCVVIMRCLAQVDSIQSSRFTSLTTYFPCD